VSSLPPVKVLLVDDLEENLLVLEALLRRDGLELLRARSGREALELLLAHDVALALLDVQMPEMDGFELAELMRGTERTRRVPIIFVTAGAHNAQRVFRGYEVGAVDFLFKPIDPILLGHKVNTFVELHRQRIELREVLRLSEMFVAAVSHDLRSPLSNVVMGAALLEREITPSGAKTLGRIRSSAARMVRMLEQLYDLSRVRLAGGIPIETRETNFRTLADKVIDELRLTYPERKLTVVYEGEATTGVWDEERLGQVLANLVGNALRHGKQDEEVRVTVHGTAEGLAVEVRNGGEIPEDLRPHLFDPFRSGSQKTRDSLGLGLYIVRQIVLAHGGTVDLTSSSAEGTTFRLQLPRHATPTPSPAAATATQA
jgi:two-component system sensor histidine kinase/response regulator